MFFPRQADFDTQLLQLSEHIIANIAGVWCAFHTNTHIKAERLHIGFAIVNRDVVRLTILVNATNPRCVYWEESTLSWSGKGCTLNRSRSGEHTTVCECNHLTSFTIIMDVTDYTGKTSALNRAILSGLTSGGLAVSCLCLAMSFVVFTVVP